jgi:hypothetical protein
MFAGPSVKPIGGNIMVRLIFDFLLSYKREERGGEREIRHRKKLT